MKSFCVEGPCESDLHYQVPPLIDLEEILGDDAGNGLLVLQAPAYTGKTTTLMQLASMINADRQVAAVLCSLGKAAKVFDAEQALKIILTTVLTDLESQLGTDMPQIRLDIEEPARALEIFLGRVSSQLGRPLVVAFDELDDLADDVFLSVFRQLHAGCRVRQGAKSFPLRIILAGRRPRNAYKLASLGQEASGFGGKFLGLRPFEGAEISMMLSSFAADFGASISRDVAGRIYHWSSGHPWLVSGIANECSDHLVWTAKTVDSAVQQLIVGRQGLIALVYGFFGEPELMRLARRIMLNKECPEDSNEDGILQDSDLQMLEDLGLVRKDQEGNYDLANRVFGEILKRISEFGHPGFKS